MEAIKVVILGGGDLAILCTSSHMHERARLPAVCTAQHSIVSVRTLQPLPHTVEA